MTTFEKLEAFFEEPEIQKKIEKASSRDEVYALVKENGIDVSEDDFYALMAEIGGQAEAALKEKGTELDESVLEDVSGGGIFSATIFGVAIKASGGLAVALGAGTGLIIGVGLVAGAYYLYKKYRK